MKKIFALILALTLALGLTACGDAGESVGEQQITLGGELMEYTKGEDTPEAPVAGPEGPVFTGDYVFRFEDVEVIPGNAFDASKLPEALSVYQVPSCALVGTDNVYSYATFEVTAYDEGNGEFVYSVYFTDPNLTTPEGLALGDSLSRAVELYGTGFEDVGGEYVYTKDLTQLRLIVENEVVVSIEYRLVTNT